jgi:outer membrane protein OmpA-like peptidoglycan-associated protein
MGPVGLYHMSTGEVGPAEHLRLALHGSYFRSSDFLVDGDTNSRLDGSLTFGFTPHEAIEIFGAILTSSNRNVRPPEVDRRDPELIKSFGDLVLGGKGVLPLARGLTAGAEIGFRFLSSISALSFSPSSTSLWIGPLATYDLRATAHVPLRLHANASFYLDNSQNLFDFSGTSPMTQEVAMFAYGIQQSRIRFALGVDAPLDALPVPLRPFAEYHAEIVTASGDPAFASYTSRTNRDQQWLTFGLRARVYRGLTIDAGVDVALRSVGYQYGPPLPPYDVIFGLGFPFDIASFRAPVVVTKNVEVPAAPTTGIVAGTIKTAADSKPLADALISFSGQAHARVATDPDGTFQSGPLVPGPVQLTIAAPGFEPVKVDATVAAGGRTNVELALVAKAVTGNVRGRVTDKEGKGIPATLRFAGVQPFEAHADANGAFSAALPVGPYTVHFEASDWAPKDMPLDIVAGQDKQLDVTLRAPNPNVTLTAQAIVLKTPIKFKSGAPVLAAPVKEELEGVAELLQDHPEIKTVRVVAHWGGPAGAKSSAKKLTERQALAIKDYLVAHGAPADRIETAGLGLDSPLVPNLGPANQVRNRRVELLVIQ